MKRFNLKKQARKQRRNDKALEEFSRSTATERHATITIGNRQVSGTLRKTGPSTLEFTEHTLAGSTAKPLQLKMAKRDNYFKFVERTLAEKGLELTPSNEEAFYADTTKPSPDADAQGDEKAG
ncbi:MAG: hypothetical protein WC565_04410 [Parcubacteria group bacterium]